MLTNDQKRILLYGDPAINESLRIATLCLSNMMHPLTRPDEYPALAIKAKRAADALLRLYLHEEPDAIPAQPPCRPTGVAESMTLLTALQHAQDDGVNYEGGS